MWWGLGHGTLHCLGSLASSCTYYMHNAHRYLVNFWSIGGDSEKFPFRFIPYLLYLYMSVMKWSHALDLHENREHASHEGGWEIIRTSNLERGHVKGLTDHTIRHTKCPLAGSVARSRNTICRVVVLFIVTWRGRGAGGCWCWYDHRAAWLLLLVFSNCDIDVHNIQRIIIQS